MKILTLLTALIIATTSFAQVPNYVPTNGLVGWWPFNGNANDESGNGNNGSINGAILTTDRNGVVNQAYSFDGVNQSISINHSVSLNFSNTYSIDYWVNNYNSTGGWYSTISKDHWSEGSGFINYIGTSQVFSVNCPNISNNSTYIPVNSWSKITIVYSNGSITMYKNGEMIFSENQSFLACSESMTFGARHFNNGLGLDNFFKGKLDDIGIWNRALTDCEIKDLYNSQLGSTNSTSSQTQTALDAYTWPVNNQTYTQSGTYSDTLVNAAGCDSIVTLNLTLNYTGINENNSSSLVISPNPTTGSFSLHGLEQLGTITSLRIIDNNGKVVQVLDPKATQFACSSLKTGVYFLEVISSTSNEIIKLIKE